LISKSISNPKEVMAHDEDTEFVPAESFTAYHVPGPRRRYPAIFVGEMSSGEEVSHAAVSLELVPLFQGCSQETLNDIRRRMLSKSFGRGVYIVKVGDIAQEMFFIIEGQVEYVDAKYRVFSHGKEGEFFGELGLLYSIPRTASVRAATDVTVLILKKGDFNELRAKNEIINKTVEGIAAKRFNRFKYELVKLAFLPDGQSMNEGQVDSFREAFYRYTENNGKLDQTGLKKLLVDMSGKEFTDAEVANVHRSLDADRDGVISFEDFVSKIRTLKWLLNPDETQKYSDKIQREIEVEEEGKSWFPSFDGSSFGLGTLLGLGAGLAVGVVVGHRVLK